MSKIYHSADYIIWQSKFCKKASEKFLGKGYGGGEILYNAVDTSFFRPAARSKNNKFTFLVTGNIRKKNKAKFLKTHNSLKPINNIPFTKSKNTLGVVHIVRDPRNVITSIKNHFGFSDYERALKYMQTEGAYMEGEDNARYAIVDSWKTHFISWMKNQSLKRHLKLIRDG